MRITIQDIESLLFIIGYVCMLLGISSFYIFGINEIALNLCYAGLWSTIVSFAIYIYK